MIQTIIEILVFQVLFLAVYELFLKNETFFNANRIYLLVTPILSLVLPFISLDVFKTEITTPFFQQLPTVFIGDVSTVQQTESSVWSLPMVLWLVGSGIALLLMCIKLIQLYKLKEKATQEKLEQCKIYIIPKSTLAFSFFNTIYIGKDISEPKRKSILDHELVHVKEKHSIDLFLFEILRIVLWFNPLVYLFQKQLRVLHEYIADTKVAAQQTNSNYYQDLLTEVFQTQNLSFTNTFFNQSLIKKRIIMLHKSKSKSIFKLKYLAVLPMLVGMLLYTSCESDAESNSISSLTTQIEELEYSLDTNGKLNDEERQKLASLQNKLNQLQKEQILPPPPPTSSRNFKKAIEGYYSDDGISKVPFSVIDEVPTFSECTGTNEEKKTCTKEKIDLLVKQNFDQQLPKKLGLEGIHRIYVAFRIDDKGNVVDVNTRASHPDMAAEAKRLVSNIPQMIPGKHGGKDVSVLYSLPIVFQVVE
ncbi:M56 family metallopeptidase [Croceibacter atlanticus]|uniref:M56 family metallopeptidase n=1 Tax=Croceibacter atlanticus TaxID=313588 RepID=UPI0030D94517|tara:strand:- start:166195 stop:167619 length:1425 start_codon:yes stop_codon:yes gene_type:complete